jgi:hypothetical protein
VPAGESGLPPAGRAREIGRLLLAHHGVTDAAVSPTPATAPPRP